ncbi:MAG: hypothetical protein K9L17_08945 [Clostridiales bacterium]|nr:hypothetical protein [Clostridiales bacterium]MCF8022804.1 hypothetical protein [Clostridiales bacterium]
MIKQQILNDITDVDLMDYKISNPGRVRYFLELDPLNQNIRRREALKITKDILSQHGKIDINEYLYELSRTETGIKALQEKLRDHAVHSLNTFLLGIVFNNKFNFNVGKFRWKLASLLHDIGYPIQIGFNLQKEVENNINNLCEKLGGYSPKTNFGVCLNKLDLLSNNRNSLDIIQGRLNDWDIGIDARMLFEDFKAGKLDHGIISALMVMKVVDSYYEKNSNREETRLNWDLGNYYKDVVDACTAIFLHNLKDKELGRCKICFDKAPLAFLLKLSDVFQDWERPSFEKPKGIPSTEYWYEISDSQIIYYVKNKERCKEIQKETEVLEGFSVKVEDW